MKIKKGTLDKFTTSVGSITVLSAGVAQFWEELQPVFNQVMDNPLPYAIAFGWWVTTYVIGKDTNDV